MSGAFTRTPFGVNHSPCRTNDTYALEITQHEGTRTDFRKEMSDLWQAYKKTGLAIKGKLRSYIVVEQCSIPRIAQK